MVLGVDDTSAADFSIAENGDTACANIAQFLTGESDE